MHLRPNHLSLPPPPFSKYPSSRLSTPLNALIHTLSTETFILAHGHFAATLLAKTAEPELRSNKQTEAHASQHVKF